MTDRSLHINKLRDTFTNKSKITIQDLIDFYKQFEEETKRSTIDWRIYKLTQRGVLQRISRGNYSLSKSKVKTFVPEIDKSLKHLFNTVNKQFPYIKASLWTTKWINEFMLHQPGKFHTLLEVDREVMESVFYDLKDKRKNVFLDPSKEIIDKYVTNIKDPIIIVPLITEAPTQRVNEVHTITIEKMLVDIFCDPDLFAAYQGTEMIRIYETALEKYHINEPKMLRYANRRSKKPEIQKIISKAKNNI
ncbi:hypothetical protein F3059_10870 [Salibacter halophilus]|uniref:Uncharacterized protein n=1 Tax=Salibacter halophilus TaxID=1803916 RepID=A0A6N6M2D9_9FLAO|nr:hypothetical protein F3059_10870 [Salibacter halophilus]